MEEHPHLISDYEYALKALNDPQFRRSEEFMVWLRDEANQSLFRTMMESREAMMCLNPELSPNIDSAWKRMDARIMRPARTSTPRKYYLWSIGTVAAIALIAIGISLFVREQQPVQQTTLIAVLQKSEEIQEVILQTEKGATPIEEVSLNYQEADNDVTVPQIHTLTTPRGKNFKVTLDDGTEVWLNAESKLQYPEKFTEEERVVTLEGEAYFHVSKDVKHPFIVKSGTTQTQVLGTEFNVRCYPQEERHVTLISGSVLVRDAQKENELKLTPGQNVALDANGQLLIPNHVDINEFIAWKDNLFCFREAKLKDIMKAVGRWYNLSIIFTDETTMNYHFSFWAQRDDSPEQALRLLNQVGKVKATLEGSQIIISKL